MNAIDQATAAIAHTVRTNIAAVASTRALRGLATAIVRDLVAAGWEAPQPERPDRDIDPLTAAAYRMGVTAHDLAVTTVELHVHAWASACASRALDPSSFPGFHRDLSVEALGTRMVGHLLDGGWRPPSDPLDATADRLLDEVFAEWAAELATEQESDPIDREAS